ncbi:MAG: zf-HC2 domain-containing protein [Candidatus Aminicenantes bacterium]|nr:zf-HC2 domain-containing protein [Candidatus Aminicenantes bacterium]
MNCQHAKDLMAIGIFGRLTPAQRKELEEHLKDCPACARRYEKTASLMGLRMKEADIPPPDLEKSWKAVSKGIESRRRPRGFFPARKWILAACSFLAVFVLGYFAGKMVLNSGRQGFMPETSSAPSLAAYVDNVKPVLVNFLNRDGVETPEKIRRLEKEIISDMLFRTRLLKEMASQNGDPEILELLQDLEFILMSMDNLKPDDRDTAQYLVRMIREKKVSLRMRELLTSKSTI